MSYDPNSLNTHNSQVTGEGNPVYDIRGTIDRREAHDFVGNVASGRPAVIDLPAAGLFSPTGYPELEVVSKIFRTQVVYGHTFDHGKKLIGVEFRRPGLLRRAGSLVLGPAQTKFHLFSAEMPAETVIENPNPLD